MKNESFYNNMILENQRFISSESFLCHSSDVVLMKHYTSDVYTQLLFTNFVFENNKYEIELIHKYIKYKYSKANINFNKAVTNLTREQHNQFLVLNIVVRLDFIDSIASKSFCIYEYNQIIKSALFSLSFNL